jgi:hypothetical protein
MALKYGVWYSSTKPDGAWTKIKVEWIDDYPPTTYGRLGRNRFRKPEDAGFCAHLIDRRTGGTSYYAPPMVDPAGWRPGETPRRTGEDYLKWLEDMIEDGSLVEAT